MIIITINLASLSESPGRNPKKPIGEFVSKEEATKLAKENNCVYKEDAGRGYRRVIASPIPKNIVEIKTIEQLVKNKNIVIVCGGGGIPVVPVKNGYRFLGWTTKGDTPAIYRSGETISLSEDLTLYAFWQMTEEGGEYYPG